MEMGELRSSDWLINWRHQSRRCTSSIISSNTQEVLELILCCPHLTDPVAINSKKSTVLWNVRGEKNTDFYLGVYSATL